MHVNEMLHHLHATGRLDPRGWPYLHDHLKGLEIKKMTIQELKLEIDLTVASINERFRSETKGWWNRDVSDECDGQDGV